MKRPGVILLVGFAGMALIVVGAVAGRTDRTGLGIEPGPKERIC
jgi:hypothetical protein